MYILRMQGQPVVWSNWPLTGLAEGPSGEIRACPVGNIGNRLGQHSNMRCKRVSGKKNKNQKKCQNSLDENTRLTRGFELRTTWSPTWHPNPQSHSLSPAPSTLYDVADYTVGYSKQMLDYWGGAKLINYSICVRCRLREKSHDGVVIIRW